MYKNTKKDDLLKVAKELGVDIPEHATLIVIKQHIEASASFKDDLQFVTDLIADTVTDRKTQEQIELENHQKSHEIEIEKLKIIQAEKEIAIAELTRHTNGSSQNSNTSFDASANSLENLLKSVKTLSMPLPSRAENLNLFFLSLERAFATKNVPPEFKAEILIHILGEKANSILLYISETDLSDYDKIKGLVLQQFQPNSTETLINFRRAQRLPNETHVQFASRLAVSFTYYLELRKATTKDDIIQLMISDKLYSTLEKETQAHISIRQGDSWYKPQTLALECDNYFNSKRKSLAEAKPPYERNKTHFQNRQNSSNDTHRRPFNRNRNFHPPNHNNQNAQARPQNPQTPRNGNTGNNVCKIDIPTPSENITSLINELQYETFLINDLEVDGLIDSGSSVLCIHSSHVEKDIKYHGEIRLQGAFSDEIAKLGYVKISLLKHPQNSLIILAAISDKIQKPLIIPPNIFLKLYLCHGQEIDSNFKDVYEKKSENPSHASKKENSPQAITMDSHVFETQTVARDDQQFSEHITIRDKHSHSHALPPSNSQFVDTNCTFHSLQKDNIQLKKPHGPTLLADSTTSMCEKVPQIGASVLSSTFSQLPKTEVITLNEADFTHIESVSHKQELESLISCYNPVQNVETKFEMNIVLSNDTPIFLSPRRLAFAEQTIVDQQIKTWLDNGIISPQESPFAAPIVLVKKKDNSIRTCIDYRKLNKVTIRDHFPLPLMENIFDQLTGFIYYSSLDLQSAFLHVNIAPDSRKYTAFLTHNGQYVFNKMPFGLTNAPSVFQKYIQSVFKHLLNDKTLIIYLDDIIVPSLSIEDGLEKLKKVFKVASDNGLQFNFKKCKFLHTKIEFLGHIVENNTISPSTNKTNAVLNFPEPRTLKHIQSFLGLTGYFRKFIKDYGLIARPLSDLLRKDVQFHFGQEQQTAFLKLKQALSSTPVLHIFQQGNPIQLHCDASSRGFGSILFQMDNDQNLHPIQYFSQKTSPQQEKLSSYELEVLAIVTALKKFRHYLLGTNFQIYTDCKAFSQTINKRDLPPKIARWAIFLQEFQFEILHRSGSQMRHVDALSRYPILVLDHNNLVQKIKQAQMEDEFSTSIKTLLQNSAITEYSLSNDILYKSIKDQDLLVVPTDMQKQLTRFEHEKGHFGITKTENLLKQQFYFPHMRKVVENVISNCVPCILASKKSGKPEGLLHPIPKGDSPLNTYHIDFLGPLPSSNKNYKHIFSVVDAFTKFIWLYPTKSTTAKDAIDKLNQQQSIFGNPFRIISDRASSFTATDFQDYCQNQHIEHIAITTGIPRGNGQAERFYSTLIPVLAKLSIDDPTKWFKFVPSVQRIINSTVSSATKFTPFQLLTGVKMRNADDIHIKQALEDANLQATVTDRETIRSTAKENILRLQQSNKQHYDKNRKPATQYKVGDHVAIKRTQFGTGLKLCIKFFGPYEIINVRPHDRYDVKKLGIHDGPNLTSTSADLMKKWNNN